MQRCDVLIVGGGPAGSTCAWRLVRAGLDVAVLDRARFPRDKVCAGWITPAVVDALALDLPAYAAERTLQPFTGFRTGLLHRSTRLTDFRRTVSFGIRRCEFDTYLLERAGARVLGNEPLVDLRREAEGWIANEKIWAPVIVGAGGHFCPVARRLNTAVAPEEDIVVAQEIEFRISDADASSCPIEPTAPELYFWEDLRGYGWCVRKGAYLNIGAGRLRQSAFPAAVREFVAMLDARGIAPAAMPRVWKGHAYLLDRTSHRRLHDDGALLVGDAAGLALAPSGEGILAAVESGLIAADTLLDAKGRYDRDQLAGYSARIEQRFGTRAKPGTHRSSLPGWLVTAAARAIFGSRQLTRRLVLEDGMLHVRRPAVAFSLPARPADQP
jgi:flavin-dependent dehydrogenase